MSSVATEHVAVFIWRLLPRSRKKSGCYQSLEPIESKEWRTWNQIISYNSPRHTEGRHPIQKNIITNGPDKKTSALL